MKKKGILRLLPNLLGNVESHVPFLPISVDQAVAELDGVIAENERKARRYLARFETKKPVNAVPVAVIHGKSSKEEIDFFLEPILQGEIWGVVTDAGMPCLADPGALLVRRARQQGIAVEVFSGPSAPLFALLLSGLSGQRFYFNGYFPKEEGPFKKRVNTLEARSKKEAATEIFIETPYRNQRALTWLLSTLSENTLLSVAWELTLPEQGVLTQRVQAWRRHPLPTLDKKNAVFLFSS